MAVITLKKGVYSHSSGIHVCEECGSMWETSQLSLVFAHERENPGHTVVWLGHAWIWMRSWRQVSPVKIRLL